LGLVAYLGFHADVFRFDFMTPNELLHESAALIDQFGPATDYQGALLTAVRMVRQDIEALPLDERPTTAYVVNFFSDGIPEPQCRAGCEDDETHCSDGFDNDDDDLIDGADEDCLSTMPDSLYGVCNTLQEIPNNAYVGLETCGEYNTVGQLSALIEELRSLRDGYGVYSVTLNTYYLSATQEEVDARCGGDASNFGIICREAIPLLQRMADEGGGEYNDDMAAPCEENDDTPEGGPPYECEDPFGDCGTPP
jgi:hypothetical protein